jgi:hypothetical protein
VLRETNKENWQGMTETHVSVIMVHLSKVSRKNVPTTKRPDTKCPSTKCPYFNMSHAEKLYETKHPQSQSDQSLKTSLDITSWLQKVPNTKCLKPQNVLTLPLGINYRNLPGRGGAQSDLFS